MIQGEHITKSYQDVKVLKDVNVIIPEGKITSLIGSNGAGKSTLLSIISRLIKGEGKVSIDGISTAAYQPEELARKLATLRQIINIQVRLTVKELVSFGRYPYSKSKLNNQDKEIVGSAIRYMELEHLSGHFIDQLSGGERQRAFIAMIIAQDTDYILLDEPLNNLDMKHSVQIMKLLRSLVDNHGKTVVLVIHDINFASCYSDYMIVLKNGELLKAGGTEDIIIPELLHEAYDMEFDIREIAGNKICLYYK